MILKESQSLPSLHFYTAAYPTQESVATAIPAVTFVTVPLYHTASTASASNPTAHNLTQIRPEHIVVVPILKAALVQVPHPPDYPPTNLP